jgi:hypothetical protein
MTKNEILEKLEKYFSKMTKEKICEEFKNENIKNLSKMKKGKLIEKLIVELNSMTKAEIIQKIGKDENEYKRKLGEQEILDILKRTGVEAVTQILDQKYYNSEFYIQKLTKSEEIILIGVVCVENDDFREIKMLRFEVLDKTTKQIIEGKGYDLEL